MNLTKRHFAVILLISLMFVPVLLLNAQVGNNNDVLNPNRASAEELARLPHLNAGLVKGILERRPFLSSLDLNAYLSQSLSAEQLTELYGKLFVSLNLNNASSEEILLVPGAGRRMAHEFDEYRPYKALVQFRKQIGKYVEDTEVARLEQYIFIPIDLNTASDEVLLTIPGLGRRMLHEFKEYRPLPQYGTIPQANREICR